MSIRVDASLIVAEEPLSLECRSGEPAVTAMLVADHGIGTYAGQQLDVDQLLIGELICRGELADQALTLHAGDRAHVTGQAHIATALDYPHDGAVYVRLTIEADQISPE